VWIAVLIEEVERVGRGRAKAKQTKVARRLKYSGGGTDLDRLRRELGVGAPVVDDADDAGDALPRQGGQAGRGGAREPGA